MLFRSKGWIALPLLALGLAGLLALLLAVARAPYIGPLLPWTSTESFHRILVVHVSFAVWPGVTGFGETLKLTAGGLGTPFTVTVAVAVAVPPGPVAVAV